MPKIPSYESQTKINIGSTPEMSLTPINQSAQAQKGVIGALENVEDVIIKVRDFRQTNEASVYHSEQTRNLENLVKQDPNIDPVKYSAELDKITLKASKNISGQLAKEGFMAKAKQQNIVTNYGIKDLYRMQQIGGAKAIILLKGEQLVDNYGDMTDIQKHAAVVDWKMTLNDALKKGVFNKAEADLIDLKTQKKLKESVVNTAISNEKAIETKNSTTLNELNKGKDGIFADLNSEQRAEMIKKVRLKINDNKQYEMEIKVDNRLDILKQLADGKIDWENSDDLIRKITIDDPELGEAIKKGTDTLFIPDLKDDAFVEATKKVFSASTKEEISTYIMNTLNANGNKEIGRERLAILINAAVERTKTLKTSSKSQPITKDAKQNEIGSAIKSITSIINPAISIPNLIINFFKNLTSGKSPKDAHDASIKNEINRVNPLSTKYKIGDIITNSKGQSAEVMGFNENGSPILKRK